jgi:hypothetical protein
LEMITSEVSNNICFVIYTFITDERGI